MAIKKRKRKHQLPEGDINITSLMDILTTLLFFILMVMSLQKFSVLESTSLTSSEVEKKKDEPTFTLQVTFMSEKSAQIWLGPIKGLDKKITNKKNLEQHLKFAYKGNENDGFARQVSAENYEQLISKIKTSLVRIKKAFPNEHQAVVSFTDKFTYQNMIDSLSSIRELGPKDQAFVLSNYGPTGKKVKTKILFPQLIIGEEGEGA